jgi:methyl-accepting chemotaxis protein
MQQRLARKEMVTVIDALADIRDSINELTAEMRTANALSHETRTAIEAGLLEIVQSANAIAHAIYGGQV